MSQSSVKIASNIQGWECPESVWTQIQHWFIVLSCYGPTANISYVADKLSIEVLSGFSIHILCRLLYHQHVPVNAGAPTPIMMESPIHTCLKTPSFPGSETSGTPSILFDWGVGHTWDWQQLKAQTSIERKANSTTWGHLLYMAKQYVIQVTLSQIIKWQEPNLVGHCVCGFLAQILQVCTRDNTF